MLATVDLEIGGRYDYKEATVEHIDTRRTLPDYYPWTGRGWVQFTYKDKYQRVTNGLAQMPQFKGKDVNVLENKDLALDPEIAYTILVKGMTQRWFEIYRVTAGGGCGKPEQCGPGVALGDFVNTQKTHYAHARAVINANRKPKPCNDVIYEGKGFIPDPHRLDRALDGEKAAKNFETLLCKGLGLANQ
ncbi:hypothetical protein LJR029_006335 [Caballeronia sp. LjRoot29]|uniref:hypothetical protein n=1 Tax=Caballeronia sp. LjRoot29 TaxID=3342315 RepID=UPI003ECE432A